MAESRSPQPSSAWCRYTELLLAELDQPGERLSLRRQRKATVRQIAVALGRWPTVDDLVMVPGAESLSMRLARVVAADLCKLKGTRTSPTAV
jgi:hypothetical protein